MSDVEQIPATTEVALMAELEMVVLKYWADQGYQDGQAISASHAGEVERAVAWLYSAYGPEYE